MLIMYRLLEEGIIGKKYRRIKPMYEKMECYQ